MGHPNLHTGPLTDAMRAEYEARARVFQRLYPDNGKCIICGRKLAKGNTSLKCIRCVRAGL